MDINTLLIVSIGVCTALITYFSFFKKKSTIITLLIIIVICAQLGLTVYKGILDSKLQNNLNNENVTINWRTGQIVNLTDNKPVISFNTTLSSIDTNLGSATALDTAKKIVSTPESPVVPFTELPDMDLSPSDCRLTGNEAGYFHGRFLLVSRLTEKVLLHRISGNKDDKSFDLLISPGESVLTPLLRVSDVNNKPDSIAGSDQAYYYFKSVDSGTTRVGSLVLTLRACKIRTYILTPNNLHLQTN